MSRARDRKSLCVGLLQTASLHKHHFEMALKVGWQHQAMGHGGTLELQKDTCSEGKDKHPKSYELYISVPAPGLSNLGL